MFVAWLTELLWKKICTSTVREVRRGILTNNDEVLRFGGIDTESALRIHNFIAVYRFLSRGSGY
jgi:hypothetical protein